MIQIVVCPTITAYDNHEYRRQIEAVQDFADRIHIDLMDGQFAPHTSVDLQHVWWPEHLIADIHLMYRYPMNYIDQLIKLKPHLVIIPFEADVDHIGFAQRLHDQGIKAGLSLLQETAVSQAASIIPRFDHILIFSGNLGEHGGTVDLGLLKKVDPIQKIKNAEIGWDGGINNQNAKQLVKSGIAVLNTGGYIQKASDPAAAYSSLLSES